MSTRPLSSAHARNSASIDTSVAGISPAEALSSAFYDTLQLLLRPFDAHRWIKLGIVCIFLGGGTPSAAFQWSLGSLPSEVGLREGIERVRQFAMQHVWVIILATALGLAVGLVLLYLRAVFRFVLVDAIVRRELLLGPAWTKVRRLGRSYFFWLVGALATVGTVLAALAVVTYPYFRTAATMGTRSPALSIALTASLLLVAFTGLMLAVLITLTDDLVVPIMYGERLPLLPAWRRLWRTLRMEPDIFALYVLLRFVVSVIVGAAVLFFLFPTLLGFLSGAVIAGALVVWGLGGLGLVWVWNPATIILALTVLLMLVSIQFMLAGLAGMPGIVLLQDFGIRFIASRTPSLKDLRSSSDLPGSRK